MQNTEIIFIKGIDGIHSSSCSVEVWRVEGENHEESSGSQYQPILSILLYPDLPDHGAASWGSLAI
jgi:hypothetical protein